MNLFLKIELNCYKENLLNTSSFQNNMLSTIPDKISGTKWSNQVKLDRKTKVCYVFLRVFSLLLAKSKLLKGD